MLACPYRLFFCKDGSAMNDIEYALKIERDGKPFLISPNVTQEIFPMKPLKVIRNMDDEMIDGLPERNIYCCIIQSADDPDINLLSKGAKYTIYSIIPFKQSKQNPNQEIRCVENSLEDYDGFTICRPIFDMYLINYKTNNYGKYRWFLEFEEA
jgi:hypothetical protein